MSKRASGAPRGIPHATPHPGFEALALKGKHHPGFHKAVAHEARMHRAIAPIPAPSGLPAPGPEGAPENLAPVAPIGPPQMPGGQV